MTHDHEHHGHSHDHGHEHSHSHSHGTESGGMDDAQKLKVRIEHWIGHNRDHKEALEEWRDKAKEMGLAEVSEALGRSAECMAESVTELEKALVLF